MACLPRINSFGHAAWSSLAGNVMANESLLAMQVHVLGLPRSISGHSKIDTLA